MKKELVVAIGVLLWLGCTGSAWAEGPDGSGGTCGGSGGAAVGDVKGAVEHGKDFSGPNGPGGPCKSESPMEKATGNASRDVRDAMSTVDRAGRFAGEHGDHPGIGGYLAQSAKSRVRDFRKGCKTGARDGAFWGAAGGFVKGAGACWEGGPLGIAVCGSAGALVGGAIGLGVGCGQGGGSEVMHGVSRDIRGKSQSENLALPPATRGRYTERPVFH